MKSAVAIFTAVCALSAAAQSDELYRYIDENGRVTYSDMPPPKNAKKVERRGIADAAADSALPYTTREAMKRYPIVLYTADCGDPCTQARELLEKRGVPYNPKDPATSEADRNALTKLVGAAEVPTLVVGKLKHIKGFEASAWNGALDQAGYPKTNPGVKPAQARRTEPKAPAKDANAPQPKTSPPAEKNAARATQ